MSQVRRRLLTGTRGVGNFSTCAQPWGQLMHNTRVALWTKFSPFRPRARVGKNPEIKMDFPKRKSADREPHDRRFRSDVDAAPYG